MQTGLYVCAESVPIIYGLGIGWVHTPCPLNHLLTHVILVRVACGSNIPPAGSTSESAPRTASAAKGFGEP